MRNFSTQTLMAAAVAGLALAGAQSAGAAPIGWNASAPTVDGGDQSNFVGSGTDAGNINGGPDSETYIANDRDWQGQTFTTGANGGFGWSLDQVSLQHVMYDTDTTFWSLDSGWGGNGHFIKVGTISGGVFTELVPETAADLTASPVPGTGTQNGAGTGLYLTYTLDAPIALLDNTEYAFMVASNGSFFETNGQSGVDNYAGGGAFTVDKDDVGDGVASTVLYTTTDDRVFHANLTANVPEPGSLALLGLGGLLIARRRRG